MPLQLSGKLITPLGSPAANALIKFKAVSSADNAGGEVIYGSSQVARCAADGTYSLSLEFCRYEISTRISTQDYVVHGEVTVDQNTSASDLEDLIALIGIAPVLTDELIAQFVKLKGEAEAAASSASASASSASTDAATASSAASTATSAASQASADAQQVASDKASVDASQQDVTTKAKQVSADAAQVASNTPIAVQAATDAKNWAVGPSGSGTGTDTNNAKYWAQQAEEKANQIFVNGGPFTPSSGSEYPDVTGVTKDTAYPVNLPHDSSYTFVGGQLAGKTALPGDMMLYDIPSNTWSLIESGTSGALTEASADTLYRRLDLEVPADQVSYGGGTVDDELNTVNSRINSGDSQLAGGPIWPVSSQESARVGDKGLSSVLFLRDASINSLYKINEGVQTGDITALSFVNLTATIGGANVTLRKIVDDDSEVNIREFGAISGSDCTLAIDKAISTGKKVAIDKNFVAKYTGTLKVNACQMRLDGDLEFMTNADGLVVRGENTNILGAGRIITNVPGYSRSLFQYLADDTHTNTRNNLVEVNTIEILSLSHKGKAVHYLAGVELNTVRQLIISSNVSVQRLTGAAFATLFECNASPKAPATTNWVNSNTVTVTFISECAKAMETRSPFFDLSNNLITETSNNTVINEGGYQTGPQTTPPIISIQNNFNHYEGFIWDHTEDDFPLVEFSRQANTGSNNQSRQNKIDLRNGYSNQTVSQPLITNGGIIDPFVDNVVLTQNDMGRRQHLVSLNASKRTLRNEATSFLGKVENWLAYANRKGYTISFKKNGVTLAKDVNNAFNNIGGSVFTLNQGTDITDVVNDRFELQVLWDDTDAVQTSFAGALFNQQMVKAMRVDLIQVGGKEVVLYNSKTLYTPFVINERPQAISNVKGVRFTFGDFVDDFIPNKSTVDVMIGSFFLTTTNKNDSYFLTKGDDHVYGDHTFAPFFSPIITDETTSTTKWRLRAFGGNPPAWFLA